MQERSKLRIDFFLLIPTLLLLLIGILFIYSSGVSSTGIVFSREYIRQIIWAGSGLLLMVLFAFIDYKRLGNISPYLYSFFALLLIVTLLFGSVVNGAKSWLGIWRFGIQPSEFTKIAVILLLAKYYAGVGKKVDTVVQFIIGLAIMLLPVLLIMMQPDLGTALVYFPIFLTISFIAGVKLRYIIFVILTGTVFSLLSVIPSVQKIMLLQDSHILSLISQRSFLLYSLLVIGVITLISFIGYRVFKKHYFYWIVFLGSSFFLATAGSIGARAFIQDYQIMRLIVFLNPQIDPQGAGWNIIQSITAVGSGGFFGKGFLHGTQSHYQYLPQQSTDFIFSIIAEEWGFIGSLAVFALFTIILLRSIFIIANTKDRFAVYIGAGIIGMFFFHFIVNIGMAIGIMPITGIPLFFLSYGGSSLWTGMILIGILMGINAKQEPF